jgi:hypothetical protein
MSGISGDRPDRNRAGTDASDRIWAELASTNERLVPLPSQGPRNSPDPGGDVAAQWHSHRGRCDIRQVVSAA